MATLKPPAFEHPSILGIPSPSGKAFQLIAKIEKVESSSSKILSQSDLNLMSTQFSSQIVLSQSKVKASEFLPKTTFQNILTIEDGFYYKDPSPCKIIFQKIGFINLGIFPSPKIIIKLFWNYWFCRI